MSTMTRDPHLGPPSGVAEAPPAAQTEWERLPPYHGESYYGLPAIKSSHYGWYVVSYFFIGGVASAAQFLATVIDFLDHRSDRPIARAGRYIALAGALASPLLLIADLHTPQRWYNMLRIFRRTSPMSIGSWVLTSFGLLSGFTALGQLMADLFHWKIGDWLVRLVSLPAALAGGAVSVYTGVLLTATSNPLWSSAFPFLTSLFASSAATTATAALTLAANIQPAAHGARRRLTWFAWISGAVELFFALVVGERLRRRKMAGVLDRHPFPRAWTLGVLGLGIAAPLAVHSAELVSGRDSRRLSTLAAILVLIGGFLLRAVFIFSGNAASKDPQHYFRITQPHSNRREDRVAQRSRR